MSKEDWGIDKDFDVIDYADRFWEKLKIVENKNDISRRVVGNTNGRVRRVDSGVQQADTNE